MKSQHMTRSRAIEGILSSEPFCSVVELHPILQEQC
jgi:hypothetical protein